ncbi:MAG: hypothetical protein M1832_004982 [Thelocarpon impressellum]|nr:MAG: hypothetical protein M1832_004982 [Thelocarpon impressellum]
MAVWNVGRIVGDLSHILSKLILIWAIHRNKSAEGQCSHSPSALYAAVFCTRYLDLFDIHKDTPWWNIIVKHFYIWTSLYVIVLMMRVYPRTREREKGWKLGAFALAGSLVLTPIVLSIFKRQEFTFVKLAWAFSEVLESVCVLPQLLLLRQTTVPTVIDSYYLLTLGAYRGFYILNWILRGVDSKDKPGGLHTIAIIFGVVQTALYLDFAWVYWSRQRVKLRGGGVVDADDLSKGWLVRWILGHKNAYMDEEGGPPLAGDNGDTPSPRRGGGRWGARGISVSADEGVPDTRKKALPDRPSPATDDELQGILEGDDEGTDDEIPPGVTDGVGAISDAQEWRDDGSK